MKKNTLLKIGSVVAGIALAFVIIRQLNKKKQSQTGQSGTDIGEPSTPSTPIANIGQQIFGFLTNWNDYTVVTQSTSLNVRQNPDSKSKVVGTLPKGSTIKAKTSGTKDWLIVSKDGSKPIGYVSASFLKPKSA